MVTKRLKGLRLVVITCMMMMLISAFFSNPSKNVYAGGLFFSDFEGGTVTDWVTQSGNWAVVTDGSYVFKQSSASGEGLVTAGNSTWTDYEVETKVKAYDMNTGGASGVLGRVVDNNNYYMLRLHQSGKVQLYKKYNGIFSLMDEEIQTFVENTQYTLKLVMNGSAIKGFIDGVEKVAVTDSTFTNGKIGARSYGQSFSIDDVQVSDSSNSLPDNSTNIALSMPTVASSYLSPYLSDNAVDGIVSNNDRWVSANVTSTHTLEIDFGTNYELMCAHVHQGWNDESPISNFTLQYWDGGNWFDLATVTGNTEINLQIEFPSAPYIQSSKLRLLSNDDGHIRVKEIKVFNNSLAGCPVLETNETSEPTESAPPQTDLFVNLSGYNLNKPKSFTAPNLNDGTVFVITKKNQTEELYTGTINGNKGYFSDFNPSEPGEYVIKAAGLESYPFSVGPNWIEKVSYQNAVDFMNDSRCYLDSSLHSCIAAVGWRDAHQFSFEIQSLVEQYFSNPSAYDRMPKQISYLSEYGELNAFDEQAPDIVKLIHWGIDRYMAEDVNHTLFKEQLAYFLYAYPDLKDYISQADYDAVLAYTFSLWGDPSKDRYNWYDIDHTADLFQTYTQVGTGKGQFPPGHSIIPNLLMYEVAKREGRSDTQQYFDAAYNNTEWIINNLNWNAENTKGQRMSERITMQALAFFQKEYPDLAPPGLTAKINEWADYIISLSGNMWDFRTYSSTQWTLPNYNEPGNVMGLPAAIYAAMDVMTDQSKKGRLTEIAMSHIDNTFGKNPTGRHFSHDGPKYFEGVETGWYSEHQGGNGQLNDTRGVFDGAPKEDHYPVNVPDAGDVGWTEGWIAFNTAWNSSLAYMAHYDTDVKVYDSSFSLQPDSFAFNDIFGIELTAPLNFDYYTVENGTVIVTSSHGDVEKLTVNEASSNSNNFRGTLQVVNGSAAKGDGIIQVPSNGWMEISYGYGFFKHKVKLIENNGSLTRY